MEVGPEDYLTLGDGCEALDAVGAAFVVGGGTAVAYYGRDRRTKDFDLFMNRQALRVAMDALSRAGFTTLDTEKSWLYKALRGECLIDIVVETRGGTHIDDDVMLRARIVEEYGVRFRLMGPEDTLFRKALTLTEGRPDWYDALSIVDRQRDKLDWTYLLYRAKDHPRRVLACLLFIQTELHAPPGTPSTATEQLLFSGDAPGPVPEWVVYELVQQVMKGRTQQPYNPRQLEYLDKAA